MATRSAAKAHRQSLKRHLRNRTVRSATKTVIKRADVSIVSGDLETARDDVRVAVSTLDRAAAKGVLHPNNAARRKSRLLSKYNAAATALQTTADKPRPSQVKPARSRAGRASSPRKTKK